MSAESKDPTEQALQALTDAEETQAKAQQEATDLARTFQTSRDDARWARKLVEGTPSQRDTLKNLTVVWHRQSDSARAASHQLKELRLMVGSTANIAAFGTSTAALESAYSTVPGQPPANVQALQQFAAKLRREPLLTRLRAALRRCTLDQNRPENRSVLALIEEAESAISAPSGDSTSPTATLIALRGAIDQAFANLLRRCEGQERAKGWKAKIQSIERRGGSKSMPLSHFQLLADQAKRMNEELSDAKIQSMSRDEVLLRYANGLQFLLGILDGVDEARLRP